MAPQILVDQLTLPQPRGQIDNAGAPGFSDLPTALTATYFHSLVFQKNSAERILVSSYIVRKYFSDYYFLLCCSLQWDPLLDVIFVSGPGPGIQLALDLSLKFVLSAFHKKFLYKGAQKFLY